MTILWLWLYNQYIYYKHFFHFNKAEHIFYSSCTVINAVNYHCIIHIYYLEKTWKTHINHIVFTLHQLSFMLIIQLSYSDSGMLVKSYYNFSYESVLDFLRESALRLQVWMKHTVHESVQRSDMFTSFWILNKTYPKRHDYLFAFNLNLDLFTLALENLYFNTLDREKVQGKSLGCIKSRGDTSPRIVHPRYMEPPQRDERATCGLGAAGCRPLL